MPKDFVFEEIKIITIGRRYDPLERLLALTGEVPSYLFGDSVDLKGSEFFLFDIVLDGGCLGRSDFGRLRGLGFVFHGLSSGPGSRLKAISLAFEVFPFLLFAHY